MHAIELKVPPIALLLIFAAAMWLASILVPVLAIAIPWRLAFSSAWALAGCLFAMAGIAAFRKAGTTVNPTTPEASSSIVASGVYRISRNPMYVGFLFALIGWAIFLSNPLAFLLLPVFVGYLNRFQIIPEERALSTRFGDSYSAYLQSVRRWL